MTVKKTLENQIRGWLPKEPYFVGKHAKTAYGKRQQPLIIPTGYTVNALREAFSLLPIFIILDLISATVIIVCSMEFGGRILPLPPSIVTWIISGIILGVCSGVILTRVTLQELSDHYRYEPKLREPVLFFLPIIVYSLIGFGVALLFYNSLTFSALLELNAAGLAMNTATLVARCVLFPAYEKKHDMCLMQNRFGRGIVAIPKPPSVSGNSYGTITDGLNKRGQIQA